MNRVDVAVVEGLAALRFPRGPVAGIEFSRLSISQSGQKLPDCRIMLAGIALESALSEERVDGFFGTWVHESIHARQPYAHGASTEYRQYRGFEEGLVEGLTRHVLERAGIAPRTGAFSYYVVVYEQMAHVLGIDTVELWRRLWKYPTGTISAVFVDVVTELNLQLRGQRLGRRQRQRLFVTAAGLLRAGQDRNIYDASDIRRQWEAVIHEQP